MQRLGLTILLLSLWGCGGSPILQPTDKALAACMTKVAPPQQFADVSDHDRRYLIACMRAKGYAFDNLLSDCNRQLAPTTLVRCYGRPTK